MERVGSRASVMYGLAKMTGGGLTKDDLMYNEKGKIVSKKKSMMARKNMRGGSGINPSVSNSTKPLFKLYENRRKNNLNIKNKIKGLTTKRKNDVNSGQPIPIPTSANIKLSHVNDVIYISILDKNKEYLNILKINTKKPSEIINQKGLTGFYGRTHCRDNKCLRIYIGNNNNSSNNNNNYEYITLICNNNNEALEIQKQINNYIFKFTPKSGVVRQAHPVSPGVSSVNSGPTAVERMAKLAKVAVENRIGNKHPGAQTHVNMAAQLASEAAAVARKRDNDKAKRNAQALMNAIAERRAAMAANKAQQKESVEDVFKLMRGDYLLIHGVPNGWTYYIQSSLNGKKIFTLNKKSNSNSTKQKTCTFNYDTKNGWHWNYNNEHYSKANITDKYPPVFNVENGSWSKMHTPPGIVNYSNLFKNNKI